MMRPQKVLDQEVLSALNKVFRAKGFEGASLKEIAEETGLKKASLYHRFPNGKKQMAEAVLDHIGEWIDKNIFKVLADQKLTPSERLNKALENIGILYNGGSESCIFRSLSMEVGIKMFGAQIKSGMELWINYFKDLGLAFGQSDSEAQLNAVQNLIDIQGSLIVTEGLSDLSIFNNTLKSIENRYNKE